MPLFYQESSKWVNMWRRQQQLQQPTQEDHSRRGAGQQVCKAGSCLVEGMQCGRQAGCSKAPGPTTLALQAQACPIRGNVHPQLAGDVLDADAAILQA